MTKIQIIYFVSHNVLPHPYYSCLVLPLVTHDSSQMILHWAENGHVTLDEELSLPQFDLEGIDKVYCNAKYLAGVIYITLYQYEYIGRFNLIPIFNLKISTLRAFPA